MKSHPYLLKNYIVLIFTIFFINGVYAQEWPAITQQTKPWARWWWQGSAVNQNDLAINLNKYHDAGLGGLELTPIYGVKGQENNFITYLSPKWMEMLNFTIKQAHSLDMGIDMSNTSGWPFGGPWIDDDHAAKNMVMKNYFLKGGQQLKENVTCVQQPFITAEGKAPAITDIVEPISANRNLQALALSQVRFKKQLPLQVLMAYNKNGQKLNLTSKVSADGHLDWTALPGEWTLYAIFMGMHGKMVERAAPGGEGMVIDHYSKAALSVYLKRFDKAFAASSTSGIRAFFNDSYEVDDASGQANFTPQLFKEFSKSRKYDLKDHLPALFDPKNKDYSRVVCDFRETISDLLLDDFTTPWHNWANGKGSIIRNQSHGSPANILDLYSASDIPETEGSEPLSFRFATSAAHITGKRLVSSESATWLGEHFTASLSDVKNSIDQYFLGGVNHVFYHGISYSPPSAPWPGWLFYASVHLVPDDPMWGDFHALNEYIARTQAFLQEGKADNDVLLYYPLFDSFSEPGKSLLKHYNSIKQEFKGTDFEACAQLMLDKGYGFDYLSDRQIQTLSAVNNNIKAPGGSYQTILLPDCRYIPLPTFDKLFQLAAAGAHILIYKNLPADVPGLGNLNERRDRLKSLLASLHFVSVGRDLMKANTGKGTFIIGEDAAQLLTYEKVRREAMTDKGLQFTRRQNQQGVEYFLKNMSNKKIDGWFPLSGEPVSVALYDPMNLTKGLAQIRKSSQGATEIYLQLDLGETCVLQTSAMLQNGNPYPYCKPSDQLIAIDGQWTVDFIKGGPALPVSVKQNQLKSWTDFEGKEVKSFSGTAKYTISFPIPAGNFSSYMLDLGQVYHTADVFLNHVKIATLIGAPYTVVIPQTDLKKTNELEIQVSNLMANRISDMDRRKLPYRIFYNTNFPAQNKSDRGEDGMFTAAGWSPLPSGLLGPVTLEGLSRLQFK